MQKNTTTENNGHPTIAPNGTKVVTIPGVQMDVALGKDVVVRIPGTDCSYKGRVVGFDPYEYIIISVRLPSKLRKQLPGNQIILKYILRGTVYGFRTYVHNMISSPAPLLFIDYPRTIEKIELRRESRREVNLDGTLHSTDGEFDCLVVNISSTGCKLSARAGSKDPLAMTRVDDTMMVSVSLGAEGIVKFPIAARNITQKKGIITIGAMFLDMNKHEEKLINTYLERVQRLTR